MEWSLENSPESKWIVTFASDTPFFSGGPGEEFLSVVDKTGAELVCASSKGRSHPVFGLWSVSLWEHLQKAIMKEDIRRIDTWTSRYNLQTVDFVTGDRDPFFNVNRPEDLDEARKLLITVS